MYLCYFKSPICDFWSCSSPLSLLSNATGPTQFGVFKWQLCPISHNDLIMDGFSRAKLYDVSRVTVSSFNSKIDIKKTTVRALSTTFYRIPIWYLKRELWRFSQDHFFEMNFKSLQKHWIPQIISLKILCTLIWNFHRSFLGIWALPHKHFSFWTFIEKTLEKKFHDDLFQMAKSLA